MVLFCLLSGGAVFLAACFPPPGWRLLGGLASPDDVSVYLAAMTQGAHGLWLYHIPFDPTLVPPLPMYTLYLALGHLSAPLRTDRTSVYHLARLVCGVLVLAVARGWAAVLFQKKETRASAWVLVAFSSGVGWLLALIPSADWQARLVDLRLPEASTFLAAFTAPHFALGIALEALAMLAFWRATETRGWVTWAGLAGVLLLALGLVYPYVLPVAYGTMGGYVLWAFWRGGSHKGRRVAGVALIGGAIPGPFVLYYVQTFFFDSFLKATHVVQNVIPTPPAARLVAGYGLPLALAVWGFLPRGGARIRERLNLLRAPSPGAEHAGAPWALLGLWALVNGLMLYLPLPFRWRMANGYHFVLALLAARGLEESALPWLRQRGMYRVLRQWSSAPAATLRRVLLILTVPSTLVVSLLGVRIALTEQDFPYYVDYDELRAMDWLAHSVSFDDVVLGAYPTGNVLPTRALCRVVVGQQFVTLGPREKLEEVARFFAAETPDEERRAILARYGVTVVYYGRWERALGNGSALATLETAPYLREIYRDGETVIYRTVLSLVVGEGD